MGVVSFSDHFLLLRKITVFSGFFSPKKESLGKKCDSAIRKSFRGKTVRSAKEAAPFFVDRMLRLPLFTP